MAVLGKIRLHSVILFAVVVIAMLAFILGDLLTSSSQIMQSNRDKVVTINGDKVTHEQFETARQQRSEFYKTMMGRNVDSEATQQLSQEVYGQFVTSALLGEVCDDYGIDVTKDELSDMAQGDNLSTVLQQIFGEQARQIAQFFITTENEGSWDEVAQQYPWATESNWDFIKDQMKLNRRSEKFQALLAAAIGPNKLEAQDYYDGDNTDCSFAFVRQTAGSVADSLVKVSDSDIRSYYASTKRQWKIAGQRRNVSYIAVPLRPSQNDYAEAEQDIQSLRDDFASTNDVAELVNAGSVANYIDAFIPLRDLDEETREFAEQNVPGAILEPHRTQGDYYMMARLMDKTVAPDSTQVSMVVVPTRAEADSLRQVLAAGQPITGYSQQQVFDGWVTEAAALQTFGPEMRNTILAMAKGSTEVKELSIGQQSVYYAIKVTDKTAPVQKAKVAIYATEVTPSTTTRRDEFGRLNQFITACRSNIRTMQDSAIGQGYMMIPTVLYTTAYNIGQVDDARQAVRFAFQGKKGDVSEIFEAGDNLLVVAITGDVEEGFQQPSDSTFYRTLRARILPTKKVAYLKDQFAAVSGGLDQYAERFHASVDTAKFASFNSRNIVGLGYEPTIVTAALKAEPGQVIVAPGRNSVVALQLISKDTKDNAYDEERAKQSVARQSEYQQAINGALSVLQYNADIEDNRIIFY